MTWFDDLTGSKERDVHSKINVDGEELVFSGNGKRAAYGRLTTPSLAELREKVRPSPGALRLRQVVADVQDLHTDPANAGALFQVASQFNLLEMVGPQVTPEQGIGRYEHDRTQGPACAIAAGAGTIYRNYFVPLDGQSGQSAERQIDCLEDLGAVLGNTDDALWSMQNGYALPSSTGLNAINRMLEAANESERDAFREQLRIGVQSNTAVTINDAKHLVSQAYCSALPVAYSSLCPTQWESFARLILEAAYEATLAAGVLNSADTGNRSVYLTLLGGGAFGNETTWILDAIERAIGIHAKSNLDVVIVSYGYQDPSVEDLVCRFMA